jgi:hypothetical protein
MMYYELYKKGKFEGKKTIPMDNHIIFHVALNATQFLPKLRMSIQDICMHS